MKKALPIIGVIVFLAIIAVVVLLNNLKSQTDNYQPPVQSSSNFNLRPVNQ